MKNRKSFLKFFPLSVALILLLPSATFAFCPVCLVATGLFTGIFRWLGVDDTIVGLWLGAFALSLSIFLNNVLFRKGKNVKFQLTLIAVAIYILLAATLYFTGAFIPDNNIFGINKIIFGIIFGSLLLAISPPADRLIRKQNQGRMFVSHQKVFVAVGIVLLFSFIFYIMIR